jgi:hypothetical protein
VSTGTVVGNYGDFFIMRELGGYVVCDNIGKVYGERLSFYDADAMAHDLWFDKKQEHEWEQDGGQ